MNPIGRLVGRVREQLAGIGESLVGNAAERTLDEQIREADEQLREWRGALAEFKARQIAARERHDVAAATVLQREAQAAAALQAGRDALAHEVALEIDRLEQARDDEAVLIAHLEACSAQMMPLVEQGERHLRRLRHRIDVLRAAQAVQRAQEAVASRAEGDTVLPRTAVESLVRARRQHEAAATPDCATDTAAPSGPEALDAKLQDAGVDQRARVEAILGRVRATAAASRPSRSPRRTP